MAARAVIGRVLKIRPASRPSRSSTGDDRRISAPADDGGVGESLADLTEAPPGVEEGGSARPGLDQALGDGHGPVRADPAAGQLARSAGRAAPPTASRRRGRRRRRPWWGPDRPARPRRRCPAGGGGTARSAASRAAPAAKRGGRRVTSSWARRGNRNQRPAIRIRPLRGRTWRSSPSRPCTSASSSGAVDGCRRWLPMSTRTPSTSMLPAIPPTRDAASWTTTDRPARASRHAAISPAGPAPITTTSELTDAGRPPVLAPGSRGPARDSGSRTGLRGRSRRGGYRWVPNRYE